MKRRRRRSDREIVGLLGVGLDSDGHQRITTIDHFVLVGGSATTHESMQDAAIRINEALERKGKQLKDAEPAEIADMLRDAHQSRR